MQDLYDEKIRQLEQFAKGANLTKGQQIRLYQLAHDFFELPARIYGDAIKPDLKSSLQDRLQAAGNQVVDFSRDLMRRGDAIGTDKTPTPEPKRDISF